MSIEALRACPVCAGRRTQHLYTQRFVLEEDHPLTGGYRVVNCATCGFVYADTAATQAGYDAFYAGRSKYDDPRHSTGSGEAPYDHERLQGTAEILSRFLPSLDVRILDVGCAGGGLLTALQGRGYRQIAGIDPSATCVRVTREKAGTAWQGWLTKLPPGIGTFDCIILSHVLEHVLDVPRALRSLGPLLGEHAVVYMEVPDAARYADYVYAPFQDFNTEHINHFSRLCLDNAAARHGLAPIAGGERVLHSSPRTFTPATYAVYRRTGEPPVLRPDGELKPAILCYIERSAALLASIDDCIGRALQSSSELIVWGAGQLTLKLLASTCLSQAKVVAFVDSNPIHQGRRLAGAPVLAPGEIRPFAQPILIGTLLHHRQIQEQIGQLGLANRIILLPESGPRYGGEARA